MFSKFARRIVRLYSMAENDEKTSKTRIVCLSDTHSSYNFVLPPAEILIHAGDFTRKGELAEIETFLDWLKSLSDFRLKLIVAGNHDITLDRFFYQHNWKRFHKEKENNEKIEQLFSDPKLRTDFGIVYLQDEFFVDEKTKLKFYGRFFSLRKTKFQWKLFFSSSSPWQRAFGYSAFSLPSNVEAKNDIWRRIPTDTDVLITHSPPFGILDRTTSEINAGCPVLLDFVRRIKPKLHVFGHIHESFGQKQFDDEPTIFVNASTCHTGYRSLLKPIVIDLWFKLLEFNVFTEFSNFSVLHLDVFTTAWKIDIPLN